jgi:hypothetical protein
LLIADCRLSISQNRDASLRSLRPTQENPLAEAGSIGTFSVYARAAQLGGVGPRPSYITVHRIHNARGIIAGAAVNGAGGEGSGPHLVVGDAMRAHNSGVVKLMSEPLDVFHRGQFQVEDSQLGAVPGNSGTHFIERTHHGYVSEVSIQRSGKLRGGLGISAGDYNI